MRIPVILALLWAACFSFGALAASSAQTDNVRLSLVAEAALTPGATIWVGVRQEIRPGWHTYWRNPGDSGIPTTIAWDLPPGVSAGAITWPRPHRFDVGPIVNYGFANEAVLLVPLTRTASAGTGPLIAKAKVDWLVCEEICIPESGEVDIDLATPGADGAALIARARADLPRPWPGKTAAKRSGYNLTLELEGKVAASPDVYIFTDQTDLIDLAPKPLVEVTDAGLRLILAAAPGGDKAHAPATISGVLDLGRAGAFDLPETKIEGAALATGGTGAHVPLGAADDMATTLLEAAVFAFLGGLILNLMPCVLPILSMKALALAQGGGDGAALKRDGVAYLIGVVLSFLVIAAALLALKAGGEAIGWGFQLQAPGAVLALALLMVAIGLNLFGVFEVPLSFAGVGQDLTQGDNAASAFFTGVLAVLVASPCTAPFMGAALGFALTQSAASALAVFLALGLGFAAPFTALTFLPGLVRLLPRPGAWMARFKEALAFPMFATAIWLVWVLAQQTGPDGVALALGAGLIVGFLAWLVPKLGTVPGYALLIVGLAGLIYAAGQLKPEVRAQAQNGAWAAWSQAAVDKAQGEGRVVLVDFGAAWCVTCLVNERVAFNDAALKAKIDSGAIATFKADWTNRDPAITAALTAFGRAGVPLYLVYPKGGGAPEVLPQILTSSLVQAALSRAGA